MRTDYENIFFNDVYDNIKKMYENEVDGISYAYGDEFIQDINKYNTLDISLNRLRNVIMPKLQELIDEEYKINFYPILKDVLFRLNTNKGRYMLLLHFEDAGEDIFKIKCSVYQKMPDGSGTKWIATFDSHDFTIHENMKITMNVRSISSPYINYMIDNKIVVTESQKDKLSYDYVDEHEDEFVAYIAGYFQCCGYINYIMAHPEYKVIESKTTNNKQNNTTNKNNNVNNDNTKINDSVQNKTHKRSNIIINGIKVILDEEKVINRLKSKKKYTGTWEVRGHYRHYKNGKSVFVKPYRKGKGGDINNVKTIKIG